MQSTRMHIHTDIHSSKVYFECLIYPSKLQKIYLQIVYPFHHISVAIYRISWCSVAIYVRSSVVKYVWYVHM